MRLSTKAGGEEAFPKHLATEQLDSLPLYNTEEFNANLKMLIKKMQGMPNSWSFRAAQFGPQTKCSLLGSLNSELQTTKYKQR